MAPNIQIIERQPNEPVEKITGEIEAIPEQLSRFAVVAVVSLDVIEDGPLDIFVSELKPCDKNQFPDAENLRPVTSAGIYRKGEVVVALPPGTALAGSQTEESKTDKFLKKVKKVILPSVEDTDQVRKKTKPKLLLNTAGYPKIWNDTPRKRRKLLRDDFVIFKEII